MLLYLITKRCESLSCLRCLFAPLSMLDHVSKRTESHVVLRLLWVFVSLEHVCPQADCLCVRNSASQLAWYACGRVPLCYITCRWVELWVHPVCVSFSVENSRNCEWLPWHAHNGVGCRFVVWMLVGFLASTLDLFEVHFHSYTYFVYEKPFAMQVMCGCHVSSELQNCSFSLFAGFLTLWQPLRKKKETTCSKPHSLKTLLGWFSPCELPGFHGLGPPWSYSTWCVRCLRSSWKTSHVVFFWCLEKKQTLSESGQSYSRYYEHLNLHCTKHMYYVALILLISLVLDHLIPQKRWSKNCTCWISSLCRWNSSIWSEVAPSKANVL